MKIKDFMLIKAHFAYRPDKIHLNIKQIATQNYIKIYSIVTQIYKEKV